MCAFGAVLVPYKITLLSNRQTLKRIAFYVLVPYKITLLSNDRCTPEPEREVLVPYKITLLSNYYTPFRLGDPF